MPGEMFEDCYGHWRGLPREIQERAHLVCLPMADLEENAAVVNALQRHAAIIR
jgi:trehalose synthase